ncbi:hypothetical protein BGZ76_011311 [Entomortierella beljakovae]|nr:hypothetical protein BGZ76_011311 [Entomortierella beljakovae]
MPVRTLSTSLLQPELSKERERKPDPNFTIEKTKSYVKEVSIIMPKEQITKEMQSSASATKRPKSKKQQVTPVNLAAKRLKF